MTNTVKSIGRNYNGTPLKPGEVLVPIPYNADFAKAYCTNPECIKTLRIGYKNFKVMYVAVPKEIAAAARSSFNLFTNESLGHYYAPNSVSMDALDEEYEIALASAPAAEDEVFAQVDKQEIREMAIEMLQCLVARSPKIGLAVLLNLAGIKGSEFQQQMQLGHDAANTVHRQAQNLLSEGLSPDTINHVQTKRTKRDSYYLEAANHMLDSLLKMYLN